MGILIFKWLTARRLYKSFGVKGLIKKFLSVDMPNLTPTYNRAVLTVPVTHSEFATDVQLLAEQTHGI
jgi:hypothetical protein